MIEKFQPDSRRTYFAEPTERKPESALAPRNTHFWLDCRKYWTWKRMYMRSLRLPDPGIEARMPMTSGCLTVSQMLMVDHSRGFRSTVGAPAATAVEAPATARTRTAAGSKRTCAA